MPNANDILFNGAVRRRIAVERFSDAQAKKTLAFLEEMRRDIVGKINAAGNPKSYSVRQQKELLRSVDDLHREVYAKVHKVLDSDFKRMAADQAKYEAVSLRSATGLTIRDISAKQAYIVAQARPMQGRFLKDWLADLTPAHKKRIDAALRLSFIEGESVAVATKRMRETIDMSANGLKALIRTSNSHIAASVTQASYEENSDIIERYEWRSTLDMRTTPICQMRDGQRWNVGEGPIPPAHVGCRSTTTVILKGLEPPGRVTYKEWLANQPADVQDEVLGKRRGADYRAGKIDPESYVSPTGRLKPVNPNAPVRPAARPTPAPAAPANLEQASKAARADVLAHGKRTGNEKLVLIDEDTLISSTKVGTTSRVIMTNEQHLAMMDPRRRMLVHHNHPSSGSLSPADVMAAHAPGASGVWAHGHNGSEYLVRAINKSDEAKRTLEKKIFRLQKKVHSLLQDAVNSRVVTGEAASASKWHIVMTILNERKLIEYTSTLKGPSKALYAEGKSTFDAIIKAMKEARL